MADIDDFYNFSYYHSSSFYETTLGFASSNYSVKCVIDAKMYNVKLLPVCCRHLGNTL